MPTHDTYIYHCLTCGRIEHRESDAAVLHCCGEAMSTTCTETHTTRDKNDASDVAPDFLPLVHKGSGDSP